MIDYELYFWCLVAFAAGKYAKPITFYYGGDEEKADNATFSILRK